MENIQISPHFNVCDWYFFVFNKYWIDAIGGGPKVHEGIKQPSSQTCRNSNYIRLYLHIQQNISKYLNTLTISLHSLYHAW